MKFYQAILSKFTSLLLLASLVYGCSDSGTNSNSNPEPDNWIIPREQVVHGGPGKDGIPSIDEPRFTSVSEIDFIPENRRVIGIKIGNTVRAYPHQVLDWHEIVNDRLEETPVAITFCPLTGTAIGWNRDVNGTTTEFGVSGLLFRNNLVPYDRATDSRWSQMQLRSVAGDLAETTINTEDLIETTWKTWKQMYPNSEVLNRNTGFSRNYTGYAYGSDYTTNDSAILFPITNRDDRLPNKYRVHGVIAQMPAVQESKVRVYPIKRFGDGVRVFEDTINQTGIVVVGSTEFDFAASFETNLEDGTELELEAVQDNLPVVMQDQEGNRWDLFGYAVEGPRTGQRLTPTHSYTGYWFAWADFFPGIEIAQINFK